MNKPVGSLKLKHSQGFTIVELLIVIVVIGILAAVTIVAYNGVTKKAGASAAQSAVSQASSKVTIYAVQNDDLYPTSLGIVGISDSTSTSYQYSVDNASSPRTFCITATYNNAISYFGNNTSQIIPASGGCPGHGQNGAVALTNLAPNPSIENDLSGVGNYAGPGAAASLTRVTSGGHDGSAFARQTWSAAQTSTSAFGPNVTVTSLNQNTAYSASVWARSSKSQRLNVSIEWYNISDGFVGLSYGTPVSLTANTWTRLTNVNATSPPAAVKGIVFVRNANNGNGADGSLWANGNTFDIDGILFSQGATLYNFADGNNTNWIWNGSPNNSSSTGPAV